MRVESMIVVDTEVVVVEAVGDTGCIDCAGLAGRGLREAADMSKIVSTQ